VKIAGGVKVKAVKGASGGRAWLGDSGTGSITVFDAAGREVANVNMPVRTQAVSDRALDKAKSEAVASAVDADQRARYEAMYSNASRARRMPLFSPFVSGANGEMGDELFELLPSNAKRMIVFDRTGRPAGVIVVPPNTMLYEIGVDYVLGVHTDSDGRASRPVWPSPGEGVSGPPENGCECVSVG